MSIVNIKCSYVYINNLNVTVQLVNDSLCVYFILYISFKPFLCCFISVFFSLLIGRSFVASYFSHYINIIPNSSLNFANYAEVHTLNIYFLLFKYSPSVPLLNICKTLKKQRMKYFQWYSDFYKAFINKYFIENCVALMCSKVMLAICYECVQLVLF